jgi:hypothetical protein
MSVEGSGISKQKAEASSGPVLTKETIVGLWKAFFLPPEYVEFVQTMR